MALIFQNRAILEVHFDIFKASPSKAKEKSFKFSHFNFQLHFQTQEAKTQKNSKHTISKFKNVSTQKSPSSIARKKTRIDFEI